MRKRAVLYGFVSVVAAALIAASPALRAGGENINFGMVEVLIGQRLSNT